MLFNHKSTCEDLLQYFPVEVCFLCPDVFASRSNHLSLTNNIMIWSFLLFDALKFSQHCKWSSTM